MWPACSASIQAFLGCFDVGKCSRVSHIEVLA